MSRNVIIIHLEQTGDGWKWNVLRSVLKVLLRRYGLKCTRIFESSSLDDGVKPQGDLEQLELCET